jgi:hypothetical protein
MHTTLTLAVDRSLLYSVASEAPADWRSVGRVLQGRRVRGDVDQRIRAVLIRRGITPPEPLEATHAPPK